MKMWRVPKKKNKKRTSCKNVLRLILTGNAGIGKSFFQLYLLHRLLNVEKKKYRFVVRQIGASFFLYDLAECKGWKIRAKKDAHVVKLLDSLRHVLYLFKPQFKTVKPPLYTTARSMSTLSPRPKRIHEYLKGRARFLYMPCWELDELLAIAQIEKLNMKKIMKNYFMFGGNHSKHVGDGQ
jgi:RHS (Retrotransposon Hot Spot) family protein